MVLHLDFFKLNQTFTLTSCCEDLLSLCVYDMTNMFIKWNGAMLLKSNLRAALEIHLICSCPHIVRWQMLKTSRMPHVLDKTTPFIQRHAKLEILVSLCVFILSVQHYFQIIYSIFSKIHFYACTLHFPPRFTRHRNNRALSWDVNILEKHGIKWP